MIDQQKCFASNSDWSMTAVLNRIMPCNPHGKRLFVLVMCMICLQILFPGKIYADTEGPKSVRGPWVQDVKWGPEINFSGKRLYGCIFIGQGFSNVVFDDCDFYGAQICQCDFRNASFKRANLSGLRLGDCKFEGADFTDAIISDIERYDGRHGHDYELTYEQLTSTYSYKEKILTNTYVQLALVDHKMIPFQLDFRGADLRGTRFAHCDLRNCDFTDAQIKGMVVNYSWLNTSQIMSTKDFKRRMLIGVELPINKSELINNFSNIEFYDSKLRNLLRLYNNLSNASIKKCELIKGQAKGTLDQTRNYKCGDLSENKFTGVDFSGINLSRQNLTGCRFLGCNFTDALFDDAVITHVRFVDPFRKYPNGAPTVDQIKSTWNYKNSRMEGIKLPKEITVALEMERQAKNKSVEKDE